MKCLYIVYFKHSNTLYILDSSLIAKLGWASNDYRYRIVEKLDDLILDNEVKETINNLLIDSKILLGAYGDDESNYIMAKEIIRSYLNWK